MRKEILVFCIINFVAAQAMAETWDETFPSDVSGGKIVGGNLKIMVTGAGEQIFEASEAARSLAKAVRKVPGVQLVMTGEALGDLTSASDEEIVKKCKNYSVHYVYITRVFEGASPEKFAVLVTVYNVEGKAVANASGEKGVPVVPGAGSAPAGDGSGAAPVDGEVWGDGEEDNDGWSEQPAQPDPGGWGGTGPAAGDTDAESESALSATEEYAKRYVWFEDWVAIDVNSGGVAARWTVPYKGKFKEPLKGREFYQYIERDDLARKYKKRAILKWSLFGGGTTVMLGGLGVLLAGLLKDANLDEQRWVCDDENRDAGGSALNDCLAAVDVAESNAQKNRKTLIIVGSVITTVGAGGMFAGSFYRAHPIPASEARRLSDGFNQELKKELGLEPEYQVPQSSLVKPKDAPKLAIVPVVSGATNGLVLNLSF